MAKSPLVLNAEDLIKNKEFKVDEEKLKEIEEKIEEDVPSGFISIKLPSNGRIEGIPKVLHFRDYSASESLDINTPSDEDRPQAIGKVLNNMCFEKNIDVLDLPSNDIIYIMHVLQATFIENEIDKYIKLDEDSEDDSEDNIELVTIPINKLQMTYLGTDENDKEIEPKIKVPFKICDKKTNDVVEFKFATLKDYVIAQKYCKEFYAEEMTKYSRLKKIIYDINSIKDSKKREERMDEFLSENFDECNEYYKFNQEYELMIAKCIQALQIVSYNGKKTESLTECWEIYSTKLSSTIWKIYNQTVDKYKFGLNEKVKVFSNKLQKELVRTVTFQLSDFVPSDRQKDDDRYSLQFD